MQADTPITSNGSRSNSWDVEHTCRLCTPWSKHPDRKAYQVHKREVHGLSANAPTDPSRVKAQGAGDPVARIRAAEHEIAQSIKDLEATRDEYHRKIIEIDNLISHYTRKQASNGR